MKKTGFTKRMLALLLVVIMTVQLLPLSVFAAEGDLKSVDTGIKVETLKQADAINWPIKIYDYLNDGMLFEFNESSLTGKMPDSQTSAEGGTVPYGGGEAPPVTKLGTDFTYGASYAWSTSVAGPYYYWYKSNYYYGRDYTLTQIGATDYVEPMHAHITNGSKVYRNLCNTVLDDSYSVAGDIRYMVVAYRAEGVENNVFHITLSDSTDSGFNRKETTMPDSSEWTYKIYDLNSLFGSDYATYVWFSWYPSEVTSATASQYNAGMDSNAYVDITHIAYFDNITEATNYGKAAVKFDNNPGEYLRKTASYTTTTTTVSYPSRPNYVLSLYYYWKEKNTGSTIDMNTSFYGLDLTTHSTDEGAYVNGYMTHSYHTWKTGSTPSFDYYDYNKAITTTGNSFKMNAIGVEEKVQTNGASYVRLTTDAPSRILLTRLREDEAMNVAPTRVPITSYINYVVMVYRANGLAEDDKYALWAQGYDNSSLSADQLSASKWGYAGLISDADVPNWSSSSKLNPQSFSSADGQWQYAVIPLKETIAGTTEGSTGGDSYMENVTRLARMGMYLPKLSDGKSLDLAYVGYFGDATAAGNFGEAAKTYLNTPATTKETTTTKTYGSGRVWNTGNNKGYGMLFASGDGNWKIGTEGGGNYGGSNTTDAYGYDNWMLGYHTAGDSGATKANSVRKNPVTLESDTGMTNQIYFISTKNYKTEQLNFDGYKLLETVTSGVMTAGLLEGSLRTVTVKGTDYRVPVYRQETVEYIAYLLLHTLRIPKRDSNGNYNSTYVSGSKSTQFGGVDLNGDGEIGMIDLDKDSRSGVEGKETNENSVDLATALRHCLGITFDVNAGVGSGGEMGSYDKTLAKGDYLIGQFADCRPYIETTMDAAYYMLNSLFIGNSFNQQQDDYYYLNMPSATLNMSGRTGTAYVFDAGFTVGDVDDAADDDLLIEKPETNKNAVVYNPVKKADGTAGTGTISLAVNDDGTTLVTGKTHYGFTSSTFTTRFPFLPVTDAEGDYAGGTYSYYYWDSAQRNYHTGSNSLYQLNEDGTSSRRNYNYALVSNGEFVYKEESNLFFDFEGDDDVYLFINGELVLDIGAGHSITKVNINVNDYVTAARAAMKELEKYGYTPEMNLDNFDAYISGAKLQEYIYDKATGKITGTTEVDNPFLATPGKIEELKRWARLDLTDGEICKFDFYYMERKSWGANMRIVTNMHITDPTLDIDKTAYQFDNEIEYGGVIDPTSSLEYNFSLNNSGNTKLYNLTFRDDVIGVSLDPTNGLTIGTYGDGDNQVSKNGIYVLDANGKTLEAKDLSAVVEGYNAAGEYVRVDVTFPEQLDEKTGKMDGGQQALISFLTILQAEGTDSEDYEDAEVTRAGMGLWVGAKVTIKGIHYMLTPEQTKAGKVLNTVYVSATTRRYSTTVGNQTLYSDAEHLVYTSGFPVHYQWAGHNIFLNLNTMLQHAYIEADNPESQLNQYNAFFKTVKAKANAGTGKGTDYIYYNLCDKYGRVGGYYPYQTAHKDGAGNVGYLINYDDPGVYTFYMLLYLKEGTQLYQDNYDASDIASGEFAIIRSQVYVADVEDSVYVLDYGLSTESLDVNGELFRNDQLFGPYGTIRAKLMGVSKTEPSYLDPAKVKTGTDYSRIAFTSQSLTSSNKVETGDGVYTVNLAIPETGKLISFDSTTGQYSLTGVGTVTITAVVPAGATSLWNNPYLYYWYDDGTTGPAWPGTIMKDIGGGKYQIDIPADVSKVIINNGSGAVQTEDLTITPGLSCTITVGDKIEGGTKYTASIETILEQVTYHAMKPDGWSDVVVHYLSKGTWQVAEKTSDTVDANGYYLFEIPGDVTSVYLGDGGNNSTAHKTVYAGREVWLDADATVKYSPTGSYTVHASVPEKWKDTVYVYYWYEGQVGGVDWPGVPMTKDETGWYTREGIPADITHLIINDGKDGYQTVDLTVSSGMETWVMVNDQTVPAGGTLKYTASVAYGSEHTALGLTFTPKDFMDEENNLWMAITVHSTSANPSPLTVDDPDKTPTIDIHNEVQMYKKITVLPATVVYYEDDFTGINYNKDDVTGKNVFEFHGNGSGRLTQSVDRDQPYGQDASYQDDDNTQHSGGSEHTVTVMDDKQVAYFTFKGTGFELISRTNAKDSASTVVRVYNSTTYATYATQYATYKTNMVKYQKDLAAYQADTTGALTEPTMPTEPTRPDALRIIPVITQFDHGNDGGDEAINQVPTIRVKDLDPGEYTVELSGMPTLDFSNMEFDSATGETTGVTVVPTTLYIDGIRIFQPMGDNHDSYTDAENFAEVKELRDLIVDGLVAIGTLKDNKLELSSGTVTWTESLLDENYDSKNEETYESTQVESTDDYMIKGPNNEVYMDGSTTNSAIVFYVTKDAERDVHDLQIAVRALDYKQFYGNGSSTPDVQLQYGVLQGDGYAWKSFVRIVSSTEQYYTIPFEECPMDSEGRYQIVVRAVNAESGADAMVSYTSVKLNGLNIEKVADVGEGTILYYKNGLLISPDYYLIGNINGVEYTGTSDLETMYHFEDGKVTLTFNEATKVAIRRELNGETMLYNSVYLDVPAGEVTIFLKQTEESSLDVDFCLHTWDDGVVSQKPNCTDPEVKTFTCKECGHTKDIAYATNGEHEYQNGVCVHCGIGETKYYLEGYINSKDYTGNDYLFVDGQLVVTFKQGSYVYVRGGEDNLTYMTAGWLEGATSAVLYDSRTLSNANKLFVPSGWEITFTLVANDDGTVTLSYTKRCPTHSWNEGEVVKTVSCTEDGSTLYTCTICGATETRTVEATGHSYGEDGTCSTCGDVRKRTIYFRNSENWATAYIWLWDANDKNYTQNGWPGDVMTPVDGENGLYSYEVPMGATYVLFNNGSNKTGNLMIPSSLTNEYNYNTGKWMYPDYYMVGYINNADYGSGQTDSGNMGIYKFVDGKLTATFTANSYVFLKTTGNADWYMFKAYCEEHSGILYNTSTGAAEKMFVPGNVEITFTLVVNDDGTLTLSYTKRCEHEMNAGEITTQPTCIHEGVKTYTCTLCGETETEAVPATGVHTFVNNPDECDYCGADRTYKVYFQNDSGLENVYIWAWDSTTDYTGGNQPGVAMTKVNETGLYSYDLSVKATHLQFNAGLGGIKTADMEVPGDTATAVQYNSFGGTWTDVGVSHGAEYCLIGYINGADTGTNDDWQDVESFRFGATYTVTFTADSYVAVKKADNSTWYWLSGYQGSGNSCTFYKDGGNEKWFVPAGTHTFTVFNHGNDSVTLSYTTQVEQAQVLTVASSIELANSAAVYSAEENGAVVLPPVYFMGDEENALNLFAINQQMNSNVIVDETDDSTSDTTCTHTWDGNDCTNCGYHCEHLNTTYGQVKDKTTGMRTFTITCNDCGRVHTCQGKNFMGAKYVNLVLSNDITVQYTVTIPTEFEVEVVGVSFEMVGKTTTVDTYKSLSDYERVYNFEGVVSQAMGESITSKVHMLIDGMHVYDVFDYSVLQYCNDVFADSDASEALKQLCVDMLYYGAASQKFNNYKTDELVTDGITRAPSAFVALTEEDNKFTYTENSNDYYYAGAALVLDNAINVQFDLKAVDAAATVAKITFAGKTYSYNVSEMEAVPGKTNRYYLMFDKVSSAAMDELITCELYQGDTRVGDTMTYSVNSYIYEQQDSSNEALQELVRALYNYGESTKNYIASLV